MISVEIRDSCLLLPVKVTPRGGKDCLLPFADGDTVLRIKVSVPPEDGKANQALIELLSDLLHVPKSRISIAQGAQSRHKRVAIDFQDEASRAELLVRLASTLENEPERCFLLPD